MCSSRHSSILPGMRNLKGNWWSPCFRVPVWDTKRAQKQSASCFSPRAAVGKCSFHLCSLYTSATHTLLSSGWQRSHVNIYLLNMSKIIPTSPLAKGNSAISAGLCTFVSNRDGVVKVLLLCCPGSVIYLSGDATETIAAHFDGCGWNKKHTQEIDLKMKQGLSANSLSSFQQMLSYQKKTTLESLLLKWKPCA